MRWVIYSVFLVSIIILTSSCQNPPDTTDGMDQDIQRGTAMNVSSTAFQEGSTIPEKYTCDGDNISPPLSWSGIPEGTRSIALIMDDPDAPRGTFTHWVIYNIPSSSAGLPENVPTDRSLPDGAKQGLSSANRIGYTGPCPPSGVHRYFFKVYALDQELELDSGIDASELREAMEGHILAEVQIMGRYSRE